LGDRGASSSLSAIPLPDDWRTQGDFYGTDKLKNFRYGEWHAHLCAFCSPFDAVWGRKGVAIAGRLGMNKTKDDSLRHWVHWNSTDNVRSLKNPYLGGRRQSEWDDHGEAYPMSHEGPHIYITVNMPQEACYLAFYIFNKDGHEGSNRFRDFLVTIKPESETDFDFARAKTLAEGRVQHFWGGVYKVFAVKGGQKLTVQIHDNWSFNTIVSGVFVDPIFDPPDQRVYEVYVPRVRHTFVNDESLELQRLASQGSSAGHQAVCLTAALQDLRFKNPLGYAAQTRLNSLAVLRALSAEPPRDIPDLILQRSKSECYNSVKMFDKRDTVYADLENRK